jgi:elongation factor Tu
VVYVNKADLADEEMLELVEIEIRELLQKHGFPENSPIIVGSALRALEDKDQKYGKESIFKLMEALDKNVPLPERDYKSPFLMPIEKSVSVPGRGQVLVGTVTRGMIKKGDQLEIVGYGENIKTIASELHVFKNSVNECKAGDNCGILARGIKPNTIIRGMMVSAVNSVQQTDHFEASVYMLKKNEGGRNKPILKGYSQSLFTKTMTIDALIQFKDDKEMLMHGDYSNVNIVTRKPSVILPGDRFTIREGNTLTSLTGVVTKALPNSNLKIPGFNVVQVKPVNNKLKNKAPTSNQPAKKPK